MQDNPDHDKAVRDLRCDLCARATINQIRDDCAELTKLYAELSESERERMKVLVFGAEADV